MSRYIMAIDQGTTGTRVMILDRSGDVVSMAYTEFPQIYPKAGWVEHDPEVIWSTTRSMMEQALNRAGVGPQDIAGIGITNQRETTVLWDKKTLKPVHNAIVWQCRRSASICDELKSRGLGPLFQERTGLVIDAYFSGTKIKWLLDNVPGLRARARTGEIAFGTIDSWLIARLTGGRVHATDHTNASRTLLYNIHGKRWDPELLELLDIPSEILPEVVSSSGVVGSTDKALLGREIPIAGIAGDQQAALFGQGCFEKGEAKNTYGTGCFLLLNTGAERIEPKGGLILTLACDERGGPCYALEGSIFVAGAVIQWLRDSLGLIENASQTSALASSVPDTEGVYMVPAFSGLGAPHWDMYARGAILGLTRGTAKAHIVRAALEGIAYQVRDLVSAFEDSTAGSFKELRVDGGASLNDFLMQFQADINGFPIDRSKYVESTGVGAAFLAGIATGFWRPGEEIRSLRKTDKRFSPAIDPNRRDALYRGWLEAVERVKCIDWKGA
ncbi:MAG: glycerol kinase GlpK [Desulfomonilia bacterium]|jgi:glycerol kinase